MDKARFIWLTYTSKDCLFLSHRGKLGFLILSLHKSENIVNSFVECHVCRNKCSMNQAMNDMRTNPSVKMCPVSVLYLFALSLSCLCNNCTVYNTQNSWLLYRHFVVYFLYCWPSVFLIYCLFLCSCFCRLQHCTVPLSSLCSLPLTYLFSLSIFLCKYTESSNTKSLWCLHIFGQWR